jgi:hypothetical protein
MGKVCRTCKEEKEDVSFYKDKTRVDGLNPQCKVCLSVKNKQDYKDNKKERSEKAKVWYYNNKEKVAERNKLNRDPVRERRKQLKKIYNITLETYELMVIEQNNLCAICNKPETVKQKDGSIKTLCVDHNHTTGEVRQLLCNRCNKGIGLLKDDISIVFKAYEYLKKHNKGD